MRIMEMRIISDFGNGHYRIVLAGNAHSTFVKMGNEHYKYWICAFHYFHKLEIRITVKMDLSLIMVV